MERSDSSRQRIESIDVLRGLAMVLMALDHARDFFHLTANVDDPLNLATTTPALYFTRWITHFCAPVFVLLSGTSIYLQCLRRPQKEVGLFVIKRGLWLILIEWTIIAFAWTFNPFFNILPFQVIWAIGISMVILGLLLFAGVRYSWILALGAIIVLGHNLLDIPESGPAFHAGFLWDLLHSGSFKAYEFLPQHVALLVYPFPAWTGVMLLGFTLGKFYDSAFGEIRRRRNLVRLGAGLVLGFVLLRMLNVYGDPKGWALQENGLYTLLSFLNTQKYPPSLLYLCMTLGPALLLLAVIEKARNPFTGVMTIFGRTAFFYYILHLYFIHFVAMCIYFLRGHQWSQVAEYGKALPFLFVVPGEGLGLWWTYGIWLFVVIGLYPLCRWYNDYKSNHREKWWLSYL